jgi:hypothetical protein
MNTLQIVNELVSVFQHIWSRVIIRPSQSKLAGPEMFMKISIKYMKAVFFTIQRILVPDLSPQLIQISKNCFIQIVENHLLYQTYRKENFWSKSLVSIFTFKVQLYVPTCITCLKIPLIYDFFSTILDKKYFTRCSFSRSFS